MGEASGTQRGDMNAYKVLVGKPEGKRLLGRPRLRWKDNNKLDIVEIISKGVDWISVAQDRDRLRAVVNTVTSRLVP
jgi:hypothetical protein